MSKPGQGHVFLSQQQELDQTINYYVKFYVTIINSKLLNEFQTLLDDIIMVRMHEQRGLYKKLQCQRLKILNIKGVGRTNDNKKQGK